MSTTPTEFLKLAAETAEHFGFRSVDELKKNPACKGCQTSLTHNAGAIDRRIDSLHGLLTAGINNYCDSKLNGFEGPVLFYNVEQVPRSGEAAIGLQIFNVEKSIAEALLIQATRALMNDLGHTNHYVRVNTVGDSDSATRYNRELTNFLKKRLDLMPPTARELMKEHPYEVLSHLVEKEHELALKSPNSLEYLSDPSRKHFREIIEYLDMSETPYEIDPKMLGHYDCYSEALFSIELMDEEENRLTNAPVVARGGRYDTFVHRNTRRKIPAAGAVVILREKKAPSRAPKVKLGTPSVYVVQLGFGPKIRSLMIIDELRRAGIPVLQDLASDSLSAQLRDAEARGVRHTIIVGQKEFVENNVILRDMNERNQEQIPVDALVRRLKRQAVVA
ncbi:MAG: His/Gly/Thr/Pro-type tRNA ligase C-terminal domain-containing protein [Patescibacteria group bacterium]